PGRDQEPAGDDRFRHLRRREPGVLTKVRYRSLAELLKRELSPGEAEPTAALLRELRHVKRAKVFSRSEFIKMCRWKSSRAIHHYRRNTAAAIRRTSREVLSARDERQRLELLTRLKGVSIPTAAEILP